MPPRPSRPPAAGRSARRAARHLRASAREIGLTAAARGPFPAARAPQRDRHPTSLKLTSGAEMHGRRIANSSACTDFRCSSDSERPFHDRQHGLPATIHAPDPSPSEPSQQALPLNSDGRPALRRFAFASAAPTPVRPRFSRRRSAPGPARRGRRRRAPPPASDPPANTTSSGAIPRPSPGPPHGVASPVVRADVSAPSAAGQPLRATRAGRGSGRAPSAHRHPRTLDLAPGIGTQAAVWDAGVLVGLSVRAEAGRRRRAQRRRARPWITDFRDRKNASRGADFYTGS